MVHVHHRTVAASAAAAAAAASKVLPSVSHNNSNNNNNTTQHPGGSNNITKRIRCGCSESNSSTSSSSSSISRLYNNIRTNNNNNGTTIRGYLIWPSLSKLILISVCVTVAALMMILMNGDEQTTRQQYGYLTRTSSSRSQHQQRMKQQLNQRIVRFRSRTTGKILQNNNATTSSSKGFSSPPLTYRDLLRIPIVNEGNVRVMIETKIVGDEQKHNKKIYSCSSLIRSQQQLIIDDNKNKKMKMNESSIQLLQIIDLCNKYMLIHETDGSSSSSSRSSIGSSKRRISSTSSDTKTQKQKESNVAIGDVVYYNPIQRERYICGTKINAEDFIVLQKEQNHSSWCTSSHGIEQQQQQQLITSRLFESTPGREGRIDYNNEQQKRRKETQPGLLYSKYSNIEPIRTSFLGFGALSEKDITNSYSQCDVPCDSYGDFSINRHVELIDNKIQPSTWHFTCSMEGEAYYSNLIINKDAWKDGNFYSTTSYQSEVPLPYFSWVEYDIQQKKQNYIKPILKWNKDKYIKGAVFMARNCNSQNNREYLISKLIENDSIFRVDSISSCQNNGRKAPEGTDQNDKTSVLDRYLFYLAFENQCTDDYITEKLWQPYVAGSIPVYYGAKNVLDHAPNHSLVYVHDYYDPSIGLDNITGLSEFLATIASNQTLFESYHKWRENNDNNNDISEHFHKRYDFTHIHSECRTCRWAYSRLYGYGWDHSNQSIRDTLNIGVPRNACIRDSNNNNNNNDNDSNPPSTTTTGLLYQPFEEEWMIQTVSDDTSDVIEFRSAMYSTPKQSLVGMNQTVFSKNKQSSDGLCDLDGVLQTMLIHEDDNTASGATNSIQRTLLDQDGVIDMYITHNTGDEERKSSKSYKKESTLAATYMLRIQTLLTGTTSFYPLDPPNRYILQNDQSRLTILLSTTSASTSTTASSSSRILVNTNDESVEESHNHGDGGTVEIIIPSNVLPLRIRFLSEDIDTFHKDGKLFENFYGKLMTTDFFSPIETYVIV